MFETIVGHLLAGAFVALIGMSVYMFIRIDELEERIRDLERKEDK